jgi:RimJ/RimL family protein N-acetyltransferase
MRLITKRLIIREFQKKDAPHLIVNINNLEVTKNLLVVPHPYTEKDAKWWINHCKEEARKKPRQNYGLAIELASERKMVGGITLNKVDVFQGTAEIGYWLGQKYWMQGLMSEAMKAMIDFGFNKLKLRRINLNAFTTNPASNGLAKKFGFIYEGMRRKACRSKANGDIHDDNIYGLLKEDWVK